MPFLHKGPHPIVGEQLTGFAFRKWSGDCRSYREESARRTRQNFPVLWLPTQEFVCQLLINLTLRTRVTDLPAVRVGHKVRAAISAILRFHAQRDTGTGSKHHRQDPGKAVAFAQTAAGVHSSGYAPQRFCWWQAPEAHPVHGSGANDYWQAAGRN